MFKIVHLYISIFFNVYLVDGNGKYVDNHMISNRQAGYQMCMDTFDIYEDKIIRTQDSRELGAKYISERDVPSRQDCYQLCCNTDKCDVFIFEEKKPGSCYLFECGPSDDFKCQFTMHQNYTSGVSKHLSELETQIKFTQHEHELTNLREPDKTVDKVQNIIPKTTTTPPGSKETLQLVPQEPKHVEKPAGRCSRNQFECHTSHECIAIYNACDGIPQCADGSDEALELNCPNRDNSVVIKEPTKSSAMTSGPQVEHYKNKEEVDKAVSKPEVKAQAEKPTTQHHYSSNEAAAPIDKSNAIDHRPPPNSNGYQNGTPQRQAMVPGNRLAYGREGEGMPYRNNNPDSQWGYNERAYHPNQQGNAQIFNHKANGIIIPNERYPQGHNFPDNPVGNVPYNNDQLPNEYMRYNYYDNQQYRMGPPNQYGPGPWQTMHKSSDMNSFPRDENMMKNERYTPGGMMPQEFYYDDNSYRGRPQMENRQPVLNGKPSIMDNRQMMNVHQPAANSPTLQEQMQSSIQDRMSAQSSYENRAHMELTNLAKSVAQEEQKIKIAVPPKTTAVPTTTARMKVVKEEHRHQLSHIKFEKLTADAAFAPSDIDGHNSNPSGAILSLTFGLLITALMVVLVGCRIRTVRRRLRRGGKAFAHDADFLVNGMYL